MVRLRPPVKGLLILAIGCLLGCLAACSSSSGSGSGFGSGFGSGSGSGVPLGPPAGSTLQQQLANSVTGVQFNGEDLVAGTIDPVIAWVGGSRRTVTVESARLIALPGFRLPQLITVGVFPGCTWNATISATAEPNNNVAVTVNDHNVRLIPIHGYQMRTGNAKCVPTLVYEVQDNEPGQYALAGLKLEVMSGGRTDSVTVYDGDFVWYVRGPFIGPPSRYNALYNAAEAAQSAYWQARS
jgi:hypothetical protein